MTAAAITAVIEKTGQEVGKATFDGQKITAEGMAARAVDARRRTGTDDATIWKQLAGSSNGYVTFREAAQQPEQTASAVSHEFCRAPLHPGPCKGWKGLTGVADIAPARPRAPKPERVPGVRLRALSDDQLAERFAEISRRDQLDEKGLRAVITEMDRREKGASKPYKPTKAQRDLDERLAAGQDYISAAASIDRRGGETLDQAVRRHHEEWLDLSYLHAEQATRGHMLSPAGRNAKVDPRSLFTGTLARARAYASEELQRWWVDNPRMNRTQFRAQLLGRAADVKAAKATKARSTGRDFI